MKTPTSCTDGCYLDSSSSTPACKICGSNCLKCSSSSQCTECAENYYLKSGTCEICPPGCNDCGSNGCVSCYSGYYFSEGKCNLCPSSFAASGPCTDC